MYLHLDLQACCFFFFAFQNNYRPLKVTLIVYKSDFPDCTSFESGILL